MEDLIRPIRLYGRLGAQFGREHAYVVHSPRDALRALGAMIPGFWQALSKSGREGIRYAVFVGRRNVDETQLDWPSGGELIRIAPVMTGSKAGGAFRTIAGVALVAAGAATMWFWPANKFGVDMMLLGGSLALGGIAQMLSPQTPTPHAKPQHGMPGIQNVIDQGGPVPLLYGRMRVGSNVISSSVRADGAVVHVHQEQAELNTVSIEDDVEGEQRQTHINSRVSVTTVDLISEGEIDGLANSRGNLRSVFLDGMPVENDDGTRNFEVEAFDLRKGTAQQPAIDWIAGAAREVPIGVELSRHLADTGKTDKHGNKIKVTRFTPCVIEVADPDVDEVDVTIQVSDLWWDANKGHTDATIGLQMAASYSPSSGDPPPPTPYSITGICEFYSITYTFPVRLPPGTRLMLKITRTDPIDQDKNAEKKHGAAHVVSYTTRCKGKFKYPASALVALKIKSDKFDHVPVRSYDVKGLLVEVPDNYDPIKRTYEGTWTGRFKRAWTDNPAWIFRDLLLNERYGAGAWVQEAYVDRYALYAIAKYCDGLVPNSDGGTEPRFTCNCYITSRTHAFALLQQLASVFRGIAYWCAGSVLTSADMPGDPTYIYNPANVVNGLFRYTGSSLKSRYTAVMVTWCDPSNGFERAVESVEDADGIAMYGYNTAEITAFGCTSRSQARRAGHWLLETSRLESDTVTFSVGLEGTLASPGQVIEIADPLRSERAAGGRVREVNAKGHIVLDRAVQATGGDYLTLVLPNAQIHRVKIEGAGDTDVVPVTPLPQAPVAGAAWAIQSDSEVRQLYRVISVSESHEGTAFTITATRHASEKFELVDRAAEIDKIDQRYVPIPVPSGLRIDMSEQRDAAMSAKVSWNGVDKAKRYRFEWQEPDGRITKQQLPSTKREWIVRDMKPGISTARVQAEAWDGRLSDVATASQVFNGLISIKGARVSRNHRSVVIDCELDGRMSTLQWHVEVHLGDTDKFSEAKMTTSGDQNAAQILLIRDRPGYCWVRVCYAVCGVRGVHSSAWYPSEYGAGMHFEKQ